MTDSELLWRSSTAAQLHAQYQCCRLIARHQQGLLAAGEVGRTRGETGERVQGAYKTMAHDQP